MLLNVAGNFISMGDDEEEKQQLLNCAVSAWNMACLEEEERKKAIKKFIMKYKKLNPSFSKKDFKEEEENVNLLINEKNKKYPNFKIQIADAIIKELDGKIHVTVATIRNS